MNINSLSLKFVFVGDPSVGKTAINTKIVTGQFDHSANQATVGAIYSSRLFDLPNSNIPRARINFWDTAGQERFRSIVPMYYRGSSAILLVFDLSNRQSYDNILSYWAKEIQDETYLKVFLIGNKTDLSERQVSQEEAKAFASQSGFDYYEISARNDDLEPVIQSMIRKVCEQVDQRRLTLDKLQFFGVSLSGTKSQPRTWGACCSGLRPF